MTAPGTAPTEHPGRILLVVSAAAFLSSLDLFIVNIAFPAIRADFPGSDLAQMSWVLNGYTVVFAAFLAVAGRLADRFGHKRVFLTGLAVFAVASAACAAAPSVGLLVAARAVQALGAAMVTPTSLSLLLAAYPADRRAHAVGIWASIGAVAAALGPVLGGLLVNLSWHWVFLVNLPVAIAALAAGVRVLGEGGIARTAMPDLAGAFGLVVGVGALAWRSCGPPTPAGSIRRSRSASPRPSPGWSSWWPARGDTPCPRSISPCCGTRPPHSHRRPCSSTRRASRRCSSSTCSC